ncbi:esterase [Bordetella genomosp. 5]|uniref:Esterase n=1 Tax=Bordetella genomosp. 5 TaxID=1395608 RepID=A0A261TVM6_9BORD|nr:alpha/beta fold hydrolase [Bordetella genomosp. 5]OZI44809.1 esterase [Bordetella genomosp. 5]OZI53738.1 esterase [Bordetella genomosp. 5]
MSLASVRLKSIRSRHIGGQDAVVRGVPVQRRQVVENAEPRAVDMNGTYAVGQLYVQEYRLESPVCPYPVLLWHGGGMTGAQWESTPDGRDGWLWRLLQAGFDVSVCDAPERGRASWAMYPQVYPTEPQFRTKEEAWSLFRIGAAQGYAPHPALRQAYPGQQFPVQAFDQFAKQFVARWLDHDAMTLRAYRELLEQTGPCILLAHSQGGGYATRLARLCPRLVRAVVAVEPTGVPDQPSATCAPHLLIWGDHFGDNGTGAPGVWADYRDRTDRYWSALQRHGCTAEVYDLPAMGITGNSHFCMLDLNSDEVVAKVNAWLLHHAGT